MNIREKQRLARESEPLLKPSYKRFLIEVQDKDKRLDPVKQAALQAIKDYAEKAAIAADGWTGKHIQGAPTFEASIPVWHDTIRNNPELKEHICPLRADTFAERFHSLQLSLVSLRETGGEWIITRLTRRSPKRRKIEALIDKDQALLDPKLKAYYEGQTFKRWTTQQTVQEAIVKAVNLYREQAGWFVWALCCLDAWNLYGKEIGIPGFYQKVREYIKLPDFTHINKIPSKEQAITESSEVTLTPTEKYQVALRSENVKIRQKLEGGGLKPRHKQLMELTYNVIGEKKRKHKSAFIMFPEIAEALGIDRHSEWDKYRIAAAYWLELMRIEVRIFNKEKGNFFRWRLLMQAGVEEENEDLFVIEPADITELRMNELDRMAFQMPDETYSYFEAQPFITEGQDFFRLERLEMLLVRMIGHRARQLAQYEEKIAAPVVTLSLAKIIENGFPFTPNQARRDLMRIVESGFMKIRDNPSNGRIDSFHVTLDGEEVDPGSIKQIMKNQKKIMFHVHLAPWYRENLMRSHHIGFKKQRAELAKNAGI